MDVQKQGLLDFLSTEDVQFSIPLFQRSYSWDLWQCAELWNDIKAVSQREGLHFFGVVIYRILGESTEADIPEISIIDGQQRVFTTSLLLSAFAEYLDEHQLTVFGLSGKDIVETYVQKPRSSMSTTDVPCTSDIDPWPFKLLPAAVDRESYREALEGKDLAPDSQDLVRALANRSFFLESMEDASFNPEKFWHGLASLRIVAVRLNEGDNAQAIFESFNSKGVPLVTADLVRNYLLMARESGDQKRLFIDYWEPIQSMFGDDPGSVRLNNAIRAWTTVRCRNRRAKSDAEVFGVFKDYCENEYDGSLEELLQELFNFSMVWAENFRFHYVKKYRTANWSRLGRKTLVSDRPRVPVDEETWNYYMRHYGVNSQL